MQVDDAWISAMSASDADWLVTLALMVVRAGAGEIFNVTVGLMCKVSAVCCETQTEMDRQLSLSWLNPTVRRHMRACDTRETSGCVFCTAMARACILKNTA